MPLQHAWKMRLMCFHLLLAIRHAADQASQCDLQIRFLRTMLEWRNEVTSDNPSESSLQAAKGAARDNNAIPGNQQEGEVMILIWPAGDFVRLRRGTTAGQIVHDQVRLASATAL